MRVCVCKIQHLLRKSSAVSFYFTRALCLSVFYLLFRIKIQKYLFHCRFMLLLFSLVSLALCLKYFMKISFVVFFIFVSNTCVALVWGEFMVFHSILLLKFPLANSLLSFTHILSLSLARSLSLFLCCLSLLTLSLALVSVLNCFLGLFRSNRPLRTAHKVFTLISVSCDRSDRAAYLMRCKASETGFESSHSCWKAVAVKARQHF